jgi:hypothetical protein
MIRSFIAAFILMSFGVIQVNAQQPATFKNFVPFKQLVPGIDFFASSRQLVAPYEKPAAEAMDKLRSLLGPNLPQGAVFICSTLAQKDSVYEPKILKMGYGWTLMATTPEVRMEEIMERIKSQMGNDVPPELLKRIQNRPPEMMADAEKQMVKSTIQQIAYAVLQSTLNKELQYRSSRLDDMGKSPLPDWLDIGIASYASGANVNLAFLQQSMEQTFPIEDIISMSRPFVASSSDQGGGGRGDGGGGGMGRPGGSGGGMIFSGGGQGFPPMGANGRMPGGSSGNGSQRGGMQQRTMSKDEQDRMLFDSQSGTFFSFMLEKVGLEKIKELLKEAQEGKESRDFITRPDVLGPDFGKIEESWSAWIKAQKPERTFGPPPAR